MKTSLLRPKDKRIILASLILGLASCSTQPKRPPYPARDPESDSERFYRQQQEVLENQPRQPYPPPEASGDEPYQAGPAPDERDQNPPYGQEQPPPEKHPSPSTESDNGSQNPPDAQSPPTARPGKNGIVESPFVPGKSVDIKGYPPGSAVKDPYTGKVFLTPMQPPAANQ